MDYSGVRTMGLDPGIITTQSGRQQPCLPLGLYKRKADHPALPLTFSKSVDPAALHLLIPISVGEESPKCDLTVTAGI